MEIARLIVTECIDSMKCRNSEQVHIQFHSLPMPMTQSAHQDHVVHGEVGSLWSGIFPHKIESMVQRIKTKASSAKERKVDKTEALRSPRWIHFDASADSHDEGAIGVPPAMRAKLSAFILNAASASTYDDSIDSLATVRTAELGLPPIQERLRQLNEASKDVEFVDYELGEGGPAESLDANVTIQKDQSRDESHHEYASVANDANDDMDELREGAQGAEGIEEPSSEIVAADPPNDVNQGVDRALLTKTLTRETEKAEDTISADHDVQEQNNADNEGEIIDADGVVFHNTRNFIEMNVLERIVSSGEDIFPPSPPHEILIDKNISIRSNLKDYHTEIDALDELVEKYSQAATSPKISSEKATVSLDKGASPSEPVPSVGCDSQLSKTPMLNSFDDVIDKQGNNTKSEPAAGEPPVPSETEPSAPAEFGPELPQEPNTSLDKTLVDEDLDVDTTPEGECAILVSIQDLVTKCVDFSTFAVSSCSFGDDESKNQNETHSYKREDSSEQFQLTLQKSAASTVNVGEPTFVPVQRDADETTNRQINIDEVAQQNKVKGKDRRLIAVRKAFVKVFNREQKKQRQAKETSGPKKVIASANATKQKRGTKRWSWKGRHSKANQLKVVKSAIEVSLSN